MTKKHISSVILAVLLAAGLSAQERFSLQAVVSGVSPADSTYKDMYGGTQFSPEFRGRLHIWKGLSVWAGYGFYSASGTTPSLEWEASSRQSFFSGGLAYFGNFSGRLGWFAGAGFSRASYKEEALDESVDGSAWGYHIEGGLIFSLSKRVFTSASVGYVRASDEVEGISVKLGGLKFGLGIGFHLF